MIKYFCDRCGKELDEHGLKGEVLRVSGKLGGYPSVGDKYGNPWDAWLCPDCAKSFWHWLDEKETKT